MEAVRVAALQTAARDPREGGHGASPHLARMEQGGLVDRRCDFVVVGDATIYL